MPPLVTLSLARIRDPQLVGNIHPSHVSHVFHMHSSIGDEGMESQMVPLFLGPCLRWVYTGLLGSGGGLLHPSLSYLNIGLSI